jgi:hypothetical protein
MTAMMTLMQRLLRSAQKHSEAAVAAVAKLRLLAALAREAMLLNNKAIMLLSKEKVSVKHNLKSLLALLRLL